MKEVTIVCLVIVVGLIIMTLSINRLQKNAVIVDNNAEEFSTAYPNQRKLAKTSDGVLHLVYHRADSNGILQIYHAVSKDQGKNWSVEQVTHESADQCFPSIAIDSDNNLHLVWIEGWPSKPGIVPYVYYRKRTREGWQPRELVAAYATYPSIAVDSHNNVHVVYGTYVYSPGYYGGGNGVRWRTKTSNGWQIEETISSDRLWARYPAIAIDSQDNVHVAWSHSTRYRYYDLHYRRKTVSGWEEEIEISRDSDSTSSIPSIAIDNNDHVHIVWHQQENASYAYATDGYWSIRHRVYTDSWQPVEVVAGPIKYSQLYPTIAIDGKNNIHIVWYGKHPISHSFYQIRSRTYQNSWKPIQEITLLLHDQINPSLMWAFYPLINGVKTNQPKEGYAFVWIDGTTIKYQSSEISQP